MIQCYGTSCGGSGSMTALRPNGQIYPCIRYMPTSVGDDVPDLCMGTVDDGWNERSDGSEVSPTHLYRLSIVTIHQELHSLSVVGSTRDGPALAYSRLYNSIRIMIITGRCINMTKLLMNG